MSAVDVAVRLAVHEDDVVVGRRTQTTGYGCGYLSFLTDGRASFRNDDVVLCRAGGGGGTVGNVACRHRAVSLTPGTDEDHVLRGVASSRRPGTDSRHVRRRCCPVDFHDVADDVPLLGIPAENLAHFARVFDNDPVALNRCTVRGPTAKDVCRIGGSGDVNVVARCPVGTVPVIARAAGVLGGVLRRVRSHLELLSGQIVRERGCLGLGEFVRTGRLRGADRQKNGGKKRRWGALPNLKVV